ncbi:uncharacterized protein LOC135489499 [Lineus longissimus]|uniref:uncharacterized protein LOC135489499 n=1 Tax=Lineus longissimus TaxID=88925 RepID=UPI00315D82D5
MAVQGILPPKFTPASHDMGVLATSWREYKDELDLYFLASGQGTAAQKQKVSLLLYQMGKQYMKVFQNELVFEADADKDKYDKVCSAFDKYFEPKKLVKSHITKFQKRMQASNETISDYITDLRRLAKLCEFGDKEDRMMSLQISNGVKDEVLRKKLWDEDLTLQQTIEKCQTFELRAESAGLFKKHNNTAGDKEVNAAYRGCGGSRSRSRGRGYTNYPRGGATASQHHGRGRSTPRVAQQRGYGRGRRSHSQNQYHGSCQKCGRQHAPRQCPAYDQQCRHCHMYGHFERKCLKKNVCFIDGECDYDEEQSWSYDYEPTEEMDSLHIYSIKTRSTTRDSAGDTWTVLLHTPYENGRGAIRMKIDTQAHCNTMSKTSFDRMQQHGHLQLKSTASTITAFGNTTVVPVGKTTFDVIMKGETHSIECEVVPGNVPNLLGAKDSERLGLVKCVFHVRDQPLFDDKFLKRISNVEKVPEPILKVLRDFPDRFPDERVGKLPGKFHLSIDPEYKDGPVSYGSRPIPAALRDMTKKQIDFLEGNDIISKVPPGVPTPWCSQLHVVHKKDGKSVRVCIDPKFLNKALLRETHPIRTLEDVLTQVQGSKYFSVLDANQGFFQLQLDYESQLLTCFSTPWGHYMYKRLPMGVKSAPEIYQRAIEEMFAGMENFANIFDDILLHTGDIEHHCRVLRKTLETARENDLTFRLSKCMFAQPEVDYTGHVLTDEGVTVSLQD